LPDWHSFTIPQIDPGWELFLLPISGSPVPAIFFCSGFFFGSPWKNIKTGMDATTGCVLIVVFWLANYFISLVFQVIKAYWGKRRLAYCTADRSRWIFLLVSSVSIIVAVHLFRIRKAQSLSAIAIEIISFPSIPIFLIATLCMSFLDGRLPEFILRSLAANW